MRKQKEIRRAEIIEAAKAAYALEGKITRDGVATWAGTSTGLINFYFKNFNELRKLITEKTC